MKRQPQQHEQREEGAEEEAIAPSQSRARGHMGGHLLRMRGRCCVRFQFIAVACALAERAAKKRGAHFVCVTLVSCCIFAMARCARRPVKRATGCTIRFTMITSVSSKREPPE